MDGPTLQQILGSAEQAAISGDYSSAEALLRQAASLQESSLGPQHPDLASTYNNLAVVCEKSNNLAAAEKFYERAFAIAFAALESDDPVVQTSRENLDEFRRVHGQFANEAEPVPAAPPTVSKMFLEAPFPEEHQDATLSHGRTDTAVEDPEQRIVQPTGSTNAIARGGTAIVIVLILAVAIWFWRTAAEPKRANETSAKISENVTSPLPPAASSTRTSRRVPSSDNGPANTAAATHPGGDLRVVEASLCQRLSTTGARWECTPPAGSSAPGPLIFYTRIAAPRGVRVHHRWYRNGNLRRDIALAVDANPSMGYRTYSRQQVDGGEWRVELATEDGVTLHEERVAIR